MNDKGESVYSFIMEEKWNEGHFIAEERYR
jgi:hypothetical protein